MQFHLIVISVFLKKVWKILEIARKKGLISMYREAPVSGFVNINWFT